MKRLLVVRMMAGLAGSGCASRATQISRTMDSWKGTHKHELILKWGPPTRIESDGKDGEILVYEYDKTGTKVEPDFLKKLGSKRGGYDVKKTGYIAMRMFWASKDGVIYHWQWRGL